MSANKRFPLLSDAHYDAAKLGITAWQDHNAPLDRIHWDQYGLGNAHHAAKRSPDGETKVGSYLATKNNEPISSGFNGFPREFPDLIMPKLRTAKYDWMVHSEANCILNAAKQGKSTRDSKMYCTHIPCKTCLLFVWQAGVDHIILDSEGIAHMTDNDKFKVWLAQFDILVGGQMKIDTVVYKNS